jgi:hypothetical protein
MSSLRRRRWLKRSLAFAPVLLLASCGASPEHLSARQDPAPQVAPQEDQPSEFARFSDVFRTGADTISFPSTSALVEQSTATVVGTFASIEPGRTVTTEQNQITSTLNYAVVKIAVDRVLHGALTESEGDAVYMEVNIPRGVSMDQLSQALPAGRRIAVAVQAWVPDQPDGVQQMNADGGRPQGARLMAYLPQGVFMQDTDGSFVTPVGTPHGEVVASVDQAVDQLEHA